MYHEKMFYHWVDALINLLIVTLIPLVPVLLFFLQKSCRSSYFYAVIISVEVTFLYEFVAMAKLYNSKFVKNEIAICIFVLVIAITCSFLMLLYIKDITSNRIVGGIDIVIVSMLFIPVVIKTIETVRCFKDDITASKLKPDEQNLVRGANNV